MSLKKTLVASTPKCAKMVASNPLIDEDLDSILEDSDNSHLKNARKNIHLLNSSTITESTEEEYETVNKNAKTVTPQNEIEIEPEPIKQKRLSSKKPQSRLTNSSLSNTTLCAKDPSHPISATETEHRDDLSSTSVSDSVHNGSVIVVNDDVDDACTVVSLIEGNQDNSTLNASVIGGNSTKSVSANKTKNIEANESDSSNEEENATEVNGVSNVIVEPVAYEPNKTKSDNISITSNKSNNVSKSSTQNPVLCDDDTDSDTETPKTRRNVSGNSICPNETFKKKLFNNYEEIAAAASVASTSVDNTSVPVTENPVSSESMFNKKCFVRLERLSFSKTLAVQPIVAPDSNGEDSADDISETNQQQKSSSVSAKSLSKLKTSISKESYLNNWVDTQNSMRETVEVVVNRKYCVTSRTTQITNSDRKRYFESDDEDDGSDKRDRRQSKRTKDVRRRTPSYNSSGINPSRVQPKRGTSVVALGEIEEVDLESVVDTRKRTRKTAASKSKVVNDEAVNNGDSTGTEATNKESNAIKNVTKKRMVSKKAEKDNVEVEEKPEPKKRGRKKKVVNLDQETEQSKEPSPMSSKASTRKNGRRNVKNEELSMPSKSTRVTGKKATTSVKNVESDSDSDNVPLTKIASKRKTATTKKAAEQKVDDNPEPESVPVRATRKTGTRKRMATESEAEPAVTAKRVMSRRNAKKPVVFEEDQISNVDSASTKNDDSDNESKKGVTKRKTTRVTKKK